MLTILISTTIIIPTLLGLGKLFEITYKPQLEGISGKILSGIIGISIIWTLTAFFFPLNIYIEIPTLLSGIFIFFRKKLYYDLYILIKKNSLILSAISFVILFCGAYYPYILDHFGYYVPTIKWIREYGLVKGISNLDITLGQMSLWHIFQAGFSNIADPFLRINSILLIVYSLYIIERKSWIQLLFIPILLLFSQSPSPDLPVIVFSLMILNEIIAGNKNTSFLFAFSVFVFIIKPTMLWLPILSLLYSIFTVKSDLKTLLPGGLIACLFFMKNIWTFGYPVFPVSIGDLGISWKPNLEILRISSRFAIQKTYDMQYSYEEIQKFSTSDYIKNWFTLQGIKSKINLFFIISLVGFTAYTLHKRNTLFIFISLSLLIKSAFVLIFSAQYRFFIDVFFVIFFIVFISCFNRKKAVAAFSFLSIIFIGFLSFPSLIQYNFPSFRLGNFIGEFKKEQFYRPSVYDKNQVETFKVGNLKFNVSKNYPFNFETPLPAISSSFIFDYQKAEIFPQLIDEKDMKKGFVWKKLNSKEKNEVQKVINSINSSYQQK